MKISELNTKSFLGNAGAAENSYILINYEDNSTSEPVTYKASLQELGKAIANDQKLYKKTQNGAITTNVSQGTYVNTAAENFASTGAVTAAVSGLASTGYVDSAISDLGDNLINYSMNDLGGNLYHLYTNYTDYYVTNAISGLASTGYVTAAVANAGGGGFNPAVSVTCSIGRYTANGSYVSEGADSLYPAMIANDSGVYLYTQTDAGKFIYSGIIASKSDLNGLACISTSDNKPCIRNRDHEFIGFLSTT